MCVRVYITKYAGYVETRRIYIYIYIHTHTYVFIYILYIFIYMYTYIHIYVYACIFINICLYIKMYTKGKCVRACESQQERPLFTEKWK